VPRSAPGMPRKMLPPPTTTAISTPSSVFAAATSSAMRWTTAASSPEPVVVSANTSPESFSTTRSYRDASPNASPYAISRRRTRGLFGTDLDPNEAADGRILAELAHELADGGLRVTDEGLLDEDRVLVEAVQPPLDDLRDRLLGLPLVAGEFLEHGPLLLEDVGRDIVARDVLRRGRRDVQRDVVRDLLGARVGRVDAAQLDEDADGPALVLDVLVPVDDPVRGLDARNTTDPDVLAQRGAELLDGVADRPALVGAALEVVVALLGDDLRERGDHGAELRPFGDEVGLAVQLDDRAHVALDGHLDRSVLCFPPGALGGAGQSLGAKPVLGRLDVAARLLKRRPAVEHPGAGLLAQRGNVLGRDLSHCSRLRSRSSPRRPPLRRAGSRTPRRPSCPGAAAEASASRRGGAPRAAPAPGRLHRGRGAVRRPYGAPPRAQAAVLAPRPWRRPSRPSSARGRGPPRRRRRPRGS